MAKGYMLSDLCRQVDSYAGDRTGELLASRALLTDTKIAKLCMSTSSTFWELSNEHPARPFSSTLLIIEHSFSEFEGES